MHNKRPVSLKWVYRPLVGLWLSGLRKLSVFKYAVESAYSNNVTASELARSSFSSGNISN